MDQFTAARLRAEKRMQKQGRVPSVFGEVKTEIVEESPKKKKVSIEVAITIGEEIFSFEFDAPGFGGTVPPNKVTSLGLKVMVLDAFGKRFGTLHDIS